MRSHLIGVQGFVVVLALIAGHVTGCSHARQSPTEPSGGLSPVVLAYIDELIGIMRAHSLNRLKIDWTNFRTQVIAAGGSAQTVAQAGPAIQTALNLLGDGHSLYRPVVGLALGPNSTRSCASPSVAPPSLPATIGYVQVGGFSGTPDEATAFANDVQRRIAAADRDGLAGWIVDLRGNRGGNMWPMIAGVGPILGEGVAGYFVDPLGAESVWGYRFGVSWNDDELIQRVDAPYRLRRESPRVAVLVDSATASSGEAVVIAFMKRPDTRSFGTSATCGLSTANQQYKLSDGASLLLTEAVMADRTKVQYGGPLLPDEWVPDAIDVEPHAVTWLLSQGR